MNPGSLILAMGFALNIIAPLMAPIPELVPKEALYGFDADMPSKIKIQLKKIFSV